MNDQVWHSGPPPSVGWWPAGTRGDPRLLRWWNGAHWSAPASRNDNKADAARAAAFPSLAPARAICWTHRPASWPARSFT